MTIIIIVGSILLTLVITAGSFYFVWKVFSSFSKSMQQSQQLIATGEPGQARIMAVYDLGGSIQFGGQLPQQRMRIDMEVYPRSGRPPFQASAEQLVSMMALPRVQPGAMVEVRFDPMNPARVALVI